VSAFHPKVGQMATPVVRLDGSASISTPCSVALYCRIVLAVIGLTHRQSYRDVFAVTIIKTMAAFFVIAVYYATGLV
jgi:H+/gluconate symporter-like permease